MQTDETKRAYDLGYEYLCVVLDYAKIDSTVTTPTKEEFLEYVIKREAKLIQNEKLRQMRMAHILNSGHGDFCSCSKCLDSYDKMTSHND